MDKTAQNEIKIKTLIQTLKPIEDSISKLQDRADKIRNKIAILMKENDIQSIADDTATISLVTRKKYKYDKDAVLNYLKNNNIVLYYETKEVIKPEFDKDLRAGKLQGGWPEGIDLEVSESYNTAIRYKE